MSSDADGRERERERIPGDVYREDYEGVTHALSDFRDAGGDPGRLASVILALIGRHEMFFHARDAPAQPIQQGERHKLDTEAQVFFYEQDFYVLSNFAAFTLRWADRRFDTSEAAYQWEKFNCPTGRAVQQLIASAPSAHEAFKTAEKFASLRRPDWNEVKVSVMRDILSTKVAQHEYVRRKLLATGTRELIEDSWRDDFWGWGPNRDGQNMLGKLWMDIRASLIVQPPEQPSAEGGEATGPARTTNDRERDRVARSAGPGEAIRAGIPAKSPEPSKVGSPARTPTAPEDASEGLDERWHSAKEVWEAIGLVRGELGNEQAAEAAARQLVSLLDRAFSHTPSEPMDAEVFELMEHYYNEGRGGGPAPSPSDAREEVERIACAAWNRRAPSEPVDAEREKPEEVRLALKLAFQAQFLRTHAGMHTATIKPKALHRIADLLDYAASALRSQGGQEPVAWMVEERKDGTWTFWPGGLFKTMPSDKVAPGEPKTGEDRARQVAEYYGLDYRLVPLYRHPVREDAGREREEAVERVERVAKWLKRNYRGAEPSVFLSQEAVDNHRRAEHEQFRAEAARLLSECFPSMGQGAEP